MEAGIADRANLTRQGAGDILLRKSVWALDAGEVAALREAFRRSQEVRDSRGYGHFASLHGFPEPGYCEHRNQLFLPWHRGYLYFFEQSLQDLVPGVALPWWDWTVSRELPPLFAEPRDADGRPNPLFDAEVVAAGGQRGPDWPQRTARPAERGRTWLPGGGLPQDGDVVDVLAAADYDDLTFRLENVHNAVHVWVDGEMADQAFAGWDPIFWAHHTMVDRLWALWQLQHPGDIPRREHLTKGLNYFRDMTVMDTLNFTDLGYDYAVAEVLVPGDPPPAEADPGAVFVSEPFAGERLLHPPRRVDVELHRLDQAVPSYEGRIFLGNPEASADTEPTEESGYLGSFFVFGKGYCWGEDEGHCHPRSERKFDRRSPPGRHGKVRVTLPADRVARAADAAGDELRVSIVPVLTEHRPPAVPPGPAIRFDRMAFVAYG